MRKAQVETDKFSFSLRAFSLQLFLRFTLKVAFYPSMPMSYQQGGNSHYGSGSGSRGGMGGSGYPASSSRTPYYNQSYASGAYYGSSNQVMPHAIIERTNMTPMESLRAYLVEMSRDGVTSYFCGWRGCQHPVGFAKQSQLVTHIRSAHLMEKPFVCAACNATFDRRQDASRHVAMLNRRQYECSGCERLFNNKDERDAHEEACLAHV